MAIPLPRLMDEPTGSTTWFYQLVYHRMN